MIITYNFITYIRAGGGGIHQLLIYINCHSVAPLQKKHAVDLKLSGHNKAYCCMHVTNYSKTTGYVTKQGYLLCVGEGGLTFKNLLIQTTVQLNNSRVM